MHMIFTDLRVIISISSNALLNNLQRCSSQQHSRSEYRQGGHGQIGQVLIIIEVAKRTFVTCTMENINNFGDLLE
jgi:hypothetical protein